MRLTLWAHLMSSICDSHSNCFSRSLNRKTNCIPRVMCVASLYLSCIKKLINILPLIQVIHSAFWMASSCEWSITAKKIKIVYVLLSFIQPLRVSDWKWKCITFASLPETCPAFEYLSREWMRREAINCVIRQKLWFNHWIEIFWWLRIIEKSSNNYYFLMIETKRKLSLQSLKSLNTCSAIMSDFWIESMSVIFHTGTEFRVQPNLQLISSLLFWPGVEKFSIHYNTTLSGNFFLHSSSQLFELLNDWNRNAERCKSHKQSENNTKLVHKV